jgi:hypothetical protein
MKDYHEITATNLQTSGTLGGSGISNCIGTFDITGGFPEFDSNESYDINITLNGNPTVTGLLVSVINGMAKFQIFEPGLYDISITDGKACPAIFQMEMSGCTALGTNCTPCLNCLCSILCTELYRYFFISIFYSLGSDNLVVGKYKFCKS